MDSSSATLHLSLFGLYIFIIRPPNIILIIRAITIIINHAKLIKDRACSAAASRSSDPNISPAVTNEARGGSGSSS
jgi:hypothetical protein